MLRETLEACGLARVRLVDWCPLPGSSSSRSYRVETASEALVVRLNAPRADPVLSLGREHDLLAAVASAGIGPDVVGIDPARKALVLRFVDAKTWTPPDVRVPRNIERAAALLRRLHAIHAACRPFEPDRDAALYCARARQQGRLEARDRALVDELEALALRVARRAEPRVLCHNDLVAANVLDTGGLLLVDFEYAVTAPAIVDLASLAAMNDFGTAERAMLLTAYYGAEGAAQNAEALAELMRLHDLLAYFWALSAESDAAFAKRAPFAERVKLNEG